VVTNIEWHSIDKRVSGLDQIEIRGITFESELHNACHPGQHSRASAKLRLESGILQCCQFGNIDQE
jgi:hypothetical protein